LFFDEHLLAVDKPAGLLAGRGTGECAGVGDLLGTEGWFTDEPLLPVNKIDPHVSGVVVYARAPNDQKRLVDQVKTGAATLDYFALVSGCVPSDSDIDLPIHFNKRTGRTEVEPRRGRPACTELRVIERVAGNTWVACRPRTHFADQIRLHLAAIGFPLTVDPEHGGGSAVLLSSYKPNYKPSRRRLERPLLNRVSLHLACARFQHPEHGASVAFEAEIPKDLNATLSQLRRLA